MEGPDLGADQAGGDVKMGGGGGDEEGGGGEAQRRGEGGEVGRHWEGGGGEVGGHGEGGGDAPGPGLGQDPPAAAAREGLGGAFNTLPRDSIALKSSYILRRVLLTLGPWR